MQGFDNGAPLPWARRVIADSTTRDQATHEMCRGSDRDGRGGRPGAGMAADVHRSVVPNWIGPVGRIGDFAAAFSVLAGRSRGSAGVLSIEEGMRP